MCFPCKHNSQKPRPNGTMPCLILLTNLISLGLCKLCYGSSHFTHFPKYCFLNERCSYWSFAIDFEVVQSYQCWNLIPSRLPHRHSLNSRHMTRLISSSYTETLVWLSSRDLNPCLYPPQLTNIYTCEVTTIPRVCGGM